MRFVWGEPRSEEEMERWGQYLSISYSMPSHIDESDFNTCLRLYVWACMYSFTDKTTEIKQQRHNVMSILSNKKANQPESK